MDNLPQVTPGQRPDVRLSPNAPIEAFGGGQGVADAYGQARGLAGDVGKIAYQEQQELNRTRIDDAVVQLSQLQQKVLKDPNTGALAARGEAAIPASKQAMEDFRKGAQDIDGTLTDPEQKRMFRAKLTEYHVQTSGILSNHVFGQIQEKKATSLAAAAEEYGNAAESFATTDLRLVKSNLADQEKKIRELSAFNGLDGTSTQLAVDKGLSGTNLRVLAILAKTENDLVAKQYYDANKDAFKGQDAIHAAELVKQGSILGEAQRQATKIMAPYLTEEDGKPAVGLRDEDAALKEARNIADPIVQEHAVAQIKSRFEEKRKEDAQVYTQNLEAASNYVEKFGDVNKIPLDLRLTLKRTDISGLTERATQIRKGEEPPPLSDRYFELLKMAAAEPEKFAKLNIVSERKSVSGPELKQLGEEQQKVIKGDEKSALRLRGFLGMQEDAGLTLKSFGVTDQDTINNFMRGLNRDYMAWKADPKNTGKEPTEDEAQDMIGKYIKQERVWYKLWLGRSPQLKAPEYTTKYSEIPDGERTAIESELKKIGEAPTRDRVLQLYLKGNGR